MGQIWYCLFFVNQVLLPQSHPPCVCVIWGCFCSLPAESQRCHQDGLACRAKNMYALALYGTALPTPAVDGQKSPVPALQEVSSHKRRLAYV